MHSTALTRITLDALSKSVLPNHAAQHGELWMTLFVPQLLDCFKPSSTITSLTLDHVNFTLFDLPTLRHTLSDLASTVNTLRFLRPYVCPSALLQFISMFSHLESTTIHSPSWIKPDKDSPHTCLHQFRGTLRLSELDDGSNPFLSLLKSHATAIEKVAVDKCNFHNPRPLQKFLSSTKQSVRSLQVVVGRDGKHSKMSQCTIF